MTKAIKTANGGQMRFGQIIGGSDTMGKFNIARDGAQKKLTVLAIVPGMRRQTPDAVFTGPGQSALDDEPNLPIKSHAKPVPVHSGMTDAQRAKIDASNNPHAILSDAANLGRKA